MFVVVVSTPATLSSCALALSAADETFWLAPLSVSAALALWDAAFASWLFASFTDAAFAFAAAIA